MSIEKMMSSIRLLQNHGELQASIPSFPGMNAHSKGVTVAVQISAQIVMMSHFCRKAFFVGCMMYDFLRLVRDSSIAATALFCS